MMTLRQYIEKEARKRYLAMYEPHTRTEHALWWDTSGEDMIKDELRSLALQQLLDKELPCT